MAVPGALGGRAGAPFAASRVGLRAPLVSRGAARLKGALPPRIGSLPLCIRRRPTSGRISARVAGSSGARAEAQTGAPARADPPGETTPLAASGAPIELDARRGGVGLPHWTEDAKLRFVWHVLKDVVRRWREDLVRRMARVLVALAAGTAIVAVAFNVLVIPTIDECVVPAVLQRIQDVTGRKVTAERLTGTLGLGFWGLGPLVSLESVAVGRASTEKSSCRVRSIGVSVHPLSSLVQRRIVLSAQLQGAEVDLVQGDDISWLGVPFSGATKNRPKALAGERAPVYAPVAPAPSDAPEGPAEGAAPAPEAAERTSGPESGVAASREAAPPIEVRAPLSAARSLESRGSVPAYTPARSDVLADRRGLGAGIAVALRRLVSLLLASPPVVVTKITTRDAAATLAVVGDDTPRRLERISLSARIAPNLDRAEATVSCMPARRDPRSLARTWLNPGGPRSPSVLPREAGSVPNERKGTSGLRVNASIKGLRNTDLPRLREPGYEATQLPTLDVRVAPRHVDIAMFDGILDLPLDLLGGEASGELSLRAQSPASWRFPQLEGHLDVRDASLHFWDAPDDIVGADSRLVFERGRLYLHGTSASFGAIPLQASGDLDLAPQGGRVRISAFVPRTSLGDVISTLGLPALPFSVAGDAAAQILVSGPADAAIVSGVGKLVRPRPAALLASDPQLHGSGASPSPADDALHRSSGASAAIDRTPVESGEVEFRLDIRGHRLEFKALEVSPLDGGRVAGEGVLLVGREVEERPDAVDVTLRCASVPLARLAAPYLAPFGRVPPDMLSGEAHADVRLRGSARDVRTTVDFSVPSTKTRGTLGLSLDALRLELGSPTLDVQGSVRLDKAADADAASRAASPALRVPRVSGCDVSVRARDLDLLPFVPEAEAVRQAVRRRLGQPVRLKLGGSARIAGSVAYADVDAHDSPADGPTAPWAFDGTLDVAGVRVNTLPVYEGVAGRLHASPTELAISARGVHDDEVLDVSVASAKGAATEDGNALRLGAVALNMRSGRLGLQGNLDATGSKLDVQLSNVKLDELDFASLRGDLAEAALNLDLEAQTGRAWLKVLRPRFSGLAGERLSGGLRWERGDVTLERAMFVQSDSRYDFSGEYMLPQTWSPPPNVHAAARDLREGSLSDARGGRWRLALSVPGAELKELVPAARLALAATSPAPADYERTKARFLEAVSLAGIRVSDPHALLRRLIRRARSTSGPDDLLGDGVEVGASIVAAESAPESGVEAADPQTAVRDGRAALEIEPRLPSARQLAALLNSLQVGGGWRGSAALFGAGGALQRAELDASGADWLLGPWKLDSLRARGEYHRADGLRVDEASVCAGDARATLRGTLLGPSQDASFRVADVPMSSLVPLVSSLRAAASSPAGGAVDPAWDDALWSPAEGASAAASAAAEAGAGAGGAGRGPLSRRQASQGRRLGRAITGALGRGQDRATAPAPASPLRGKLHASGSLRGSAARPTGDLAVRLFDAAVGKVQLASARAFASLEEDGLLRFALGAEPSDRGGRSPAAASGEVRAEGALRVPAAGRPAEIDAKFSARDDGFALLLGAAPGLDWGGGSGELAVRLEGPVASPSLGARVSVSRAVLDCPVLRSPLRVISLTARVEDGALVLDSLEARSGRVGSVRARGSLGLGLGPPPARAAGRASESLRMTASGLDLRVRSGYSGRCDAAVDVSGSLLRPRVSGSVALSRGTVQVLPQAVPGDGGAHRAARGALEPSVELRGLALRLGPDLRVALPLVLGASIEGELVANGLADPTSVALSGELRLPNGELNLLATQLALDRSHPNVVRWRGEPGGAADPDVDVLLRGGDLRVAVRGRARDWKRHLELRSGDDGADDPSRIGERAVHNVGIAAEVRPGAHPFAAAAAARAFETNLRAALLAEDGRLALGRLAGAAAASLIPKLETAGTLGTTTWRLVSAPSLPGLLRPGVPDTGLLSGIGLGAEVEVRFGGRLRVAMERKPRGASISTHWKLDYRLADTLRVQLDLDPASPRDRTVFLKFDSRGAKGA